MRWLKSLLAWREVERAGVYSYQENAVTGRRRAVRVMSGGWSPLATWWLEGKPEPALIPPHGGDGGVARGNAAF